MDTADFIRKRGIRALYHFTDARNIRSIKETGGLYSLKELQRRMIVPPYPGGNEWSHNADAMNGVDDYVHLCFLAKHPMAYRAREDGRIEEVRFLEIDPQVMNHPGTLFCAEVSNSSGAQLLTLPAADKAIDFEALFEYLDWKVPELQQRRTSAEKSEILIPRAIGLKYIRNL